MQMRKLRLTGWIACLTLAIGLVVPTPSRADAIDFVMDIMYKAGVVDSNVMSAKTLIRCSALVQG